MLQIELLGGLHFILNDTPLTGFISGKTQALLCYLVMNRQMPQMRPTLATLFWGDKPDEDAGTNLRQSIGNLKKLLEPYLEITRQSVAFRVEQPYWLDVEAFEATRDPHLYRGEFLAGFGLPDAPEFDDWLTSERERLHEIALSALRQHATEMQSNGDAETACASWQRLIVLDPLAEDAHRQLMLTLALNGQRSAALAQYDLCRDVLEQELGIEPEAETTRLYQRIKLARRLHSLPAETTPMIGRETELRELYRLLRDPACRLISIVGLGGIGKTSLALHAARQFARHMLHGVAMVNLVSAGTLDFFWTALADGIGYSFTRDGAPRQQIVNFLREKHLLLVLDNFEQLAGQASDFLLELMRQAPDVKLLVTSRERLNLRGEWVLALHGLPVSSSDGRETASAQALFWETARRVRGDDLLTNQSAATVTRICTLVDGMPLAIELAAAWARLLSVEELAEEIASNLTALEATSRSVSGERHHSLRAVFDQSWMLFSDQERRVLKTLSIFASGFTREAAEKTASASLSVLLGLADKMLLRRDASNRFSLHEMMRQYLAEKLAQDEERHEITQRFIDTLTQFLEIRERPLRSSEQITALAEIGLEIDNLHVAWKLAIAQNDALTLTRLLPGLTRYHDIKSSWLVAERLLQEAEPVLRSADVATQGTWFSYRAQFSARLDQIEEMEAYAHQCRETLSIADPAHLPAIARALNASGYAERLRGDYAAAADYYQRAYDIRVGLNDEWGCAECLLSLGSAYGRQGNDVEALRLTRQGLEISHKLGDLFQTAQLQTLLAILLQRAGDLDAAESIHHETLTIYQRLNSDEGCSLTYSGLGDTAFFRQDYSAAQRWYQESLALSRQLGTREWEGGTLNNLGEVARALGDLKSALAHFRQAQEVFRSLDHQEYVDLLQGEIDATDQQLHRENPG